MKPSGDRKTEKRVAAAAAGAALTAAAIYGLVAIGSAGRGELENTRPTVLLPEQATAPPVSAPAAGTAGLPTSFDGAIIPAEDISHALALPEKAILRDVTTYSRDLGIQCGEVSLDGTGAEFKRFLYIRQMKTGRVDDGTQDFRTHAANVCVQRS